MKKLEIESSWGEKEEIEKGIAIIVKAINVHQSVQRLNILCTQFHFDFVVGEFLSLDECKKVFEENLSLIHFTLHLYDKEHKWKFWPFVNRNIESQKQTRFQKVKVASQLDVGAGVRNNKRKAEELETNDNEPQSKKQKIDD